MSLYRYAPAGTPIPLTQLAAWGAEGARGRERLEDLRASVLQRFGLASCSFVSSGRAAMYLLLRMLSARHPQRDEVVVPAYTCYSVAASAVRAGLKVRVCDVDPRTLSYDLDALRGLDCSRVLAIVSANLYGLPDPLPQIEALARDRGVYLIDDAAQAMGARLGERHCGSFGDFGIYSLDKGKNITSMQGGMIVTRDPDLARLVADEVAALPPAPRAQTFSYGLQLVAYALLLRPSLYWIPERLLDLGGTAYTTEYPVTRYSPALAGLPWRLLRNLDALQARRRLNAETLQETLADLQAVSTVRVPAEADPAYVRLPLLVDPRQRDEVVRDLVSAGIGASASYPRSIQDVPELREHLRSDAKAATGGREVARRILTLPTHPYIGSRQIATVGMRMHAALGPRAARGVARSA